MPSILPERSRPRATRFRLWHDEQVSDLGRERYVSLTTYRRDGSQVATPVWIVQDGARLYVWTGSQTGKAKRIRRNPEVTLAACTARGVPRGPAVPARARIVPAADRPQVWQLLLAKYGLQLRAIIWWEKVMRLLRRQASPPAHIYLELTLADSAAG
jgi:uncharacterized protein